MYRAAGKAYLVAVSATEEQFWVMLPYQADRPAAWRTLTAEAEGALALASGVREGLPSRVARLPRLLLEGAWAEARELALIVRATESDVESFAATSALGTLAYEQGDVALAWELVQETLPAGPDTAPGGAYFLASLGMQRVAAALARDAGDLAEACRWLEAHDRWLDQSGVALGQAEGQLAWAAYHHAAGQPALAETRARRALAAATTPRQPLALLAAHRFLGQLAIEAGELADAAVHLEAALTHADACATPHGQAVTLLATAAARERGGELDVARALAEEARAICERMGATPALARADALLARLAAAQAQPLTYPAGLTAREVEVLRLVAAGRTNQEIADALGVRKKTAINHVAHILSKTDSANRAAAAVFALRHGLA